MHRIALALLTFVLALAACSTAPAPTTGSEDVRTVALAVGQGYGTGRALYVEPSGEGPYSALLSSIDADAGTASVTFIDDGVPTTIADVPEIPYVTTPCAVDFGDVSPDHCPETGLPCWTVGVYIESASPLVRYPAKITGRSSVDGSWSGFTFQHGAFTDVPQCDVVFGPSGGYVLSPLGGG